MNCKEPECGGKVVANGLCSKHYQRARRATPNRGRQPRYPPEIRERFGGAPKISLRADPDLWRFVQEHGGSAWVRQVLTRAWAEERGRGDEGPPALETWERDDRWRRSHARELQQYGGRWVALYDGSIVAAGEDACAAAEEARRRGIPGPYVFYVEPEAERDTIWIGL